MMTYESNDVSTYATIYQVDAGSKTINSFSDCVTIKARRFKSEDYFRRTLRNMMTCYTESAGSFLYLISLVLTRGLQNIKEDMDDAEMTCEYFVVLPYMVI